MPAAGNGGLSRKQMITEPSNDKGTETVKQVKSALRIDVRNLV